jgi:hypothetical protein
MQLAERVVREGETIDEPDEETDFFVAAFRMGRAAR